MASEDSNPALTESGDSKEMETKKDDPVVSEENCVEVACPATEDSGGTEKPDAMDMQEENVSNLPSSITESSASQEPEAASSSSSSEPSESNTTPKEMVDFKLIYNKQKFDVSFDLNETVSSLKNHIEKLTNVPVAMQKIMFKGKMQDEQTLRDNKVTKGSKIMVIGSTVSDVMAMTAPDPKVLKEEAKAEAAAKEPISKQKPHKTVLEKYKKPDDIVPGKKNAKEPLPHVPLSGMYNKSGNKVRLTFKMEQDQVWIGTKERTDKIPMGSIKAVVSEPIDGHEEYHMMAIQLGPTEASRYWIYWVPAQYVDSIKDAILGKWQTEFF